MKNLNIPAQSIVFGTITNLLNGAFASLSGPIGFTPEQPRIIVKSIQILNANDEEPVGYIIYKGASGASASGTQVLIGTVAVYSSVTIDTDIVLDAGDFLTGTSNSGGGPLIVNISAQIEY